MPMILIAHDLRSAHNVGSLLRTAEGLGAEVILTGYTPYPTSESDSRLPHEAAKLTRQIRKTALGAEASRLWSREASIAAAIDRLKSEGYVIAALEQTGHSIPLPGYAIPEKFALILGREVEGVDPAILARTDIQLEIPMFGQKESFNVVQAAAMALYQWRFAPGV